MSRAEVDGFVSYRVEGGWRAGVRFGDAIVDAAAAAVAGGVAVDEAKDWGSVSAILRADALEDGRFAAGAELLANAGVVVDRPELGPPVPDPAKIICIGLNYRAHASEVAMDEPEAPILFPKFANALIGPDAAIPLPPTSQEVDYEGELAVVIGKRCHAVGEAEALDVIAGYMAFNDISARDLQMRVSQWTAGKAIDGFAPCGPALIPSSRVPDPEDLTLRTRVNGEVMQEASTVQMIFSVRHLIAYVTSLMTLDPGDIIATGTPDGVGYTREPPVFLRDGDVVEVEVDGVGLLSNPVRAAAR